MRSRFVLIERCVNHARERICLYCGHRHETDAPAAQAVRAAVRLQEQNNLRLFRGPEQKYTEMGEKKP